MAEREACGLPSRRTTRGPVATEPEVEASRPLVEEALETPTVPEASVEDVVDDTVLPLVSAPTEEQAVGVMDSGMDIPEYGGEEAEPVDISPAAPMTLSVIEEDRAPPPIDAATWHPLETLGDTMFTYRG